MAEEKLEERIRTLEIRAAAIIASLGTLATCSVAFLGYEYYRIANRVQVEIDKAIGQETMQQINSALDNARMLEEKIKGINGRNARIEENVQHGTLIKPPAATRTEDWIAFIAPMEMGTAEPGSEQDNALLVFNTGLTATAEGWQVTAQYKYRYSSTGKWKEGHWLNGKARVLLIPSLAVPPSGQIPAGGPNAGQADH